jgi:short-subunit dehydrogenase
MFNHLNVKEIESFVSDVSSQTVDIVLIAHGSLTSQSKASVEANYLWAELQTNALSPIIFAELWSGVLERQGFGKLAVIGSVAGDRGRAINHGYGAAKSAIETYAAGLQHRLASSKVQVSLVKPGPTMTPMTRGVHVGPSKLADARIVASQIVDGIERGKRVIYAPRVWSLIMFVVRVMPFSILKKMNF